jgi:hypothetical protein
MSRVWTPKEFKSHFRNLVKDCGGVQAAGTVLGISHQRVSQMQNLNTEEDLPTFLQVMALEDAVDRSVVMSAAAHAIQGTADHEIAEAAIAAVTKTAEALHVIHEMEQDGHRELHEIRAAQGVTEDAFATVQRLRLVASRLTPTRAG